MDWQIFNPIPMPSCFVVVKGWKSRLNTSASIPGPVSETAESRALSKELKKLGWKFVGPTTVYSFMQAMGLVNDHAQDCVVRVQAARERRRFAPPSR